MSNILSMGIQNIVNLRQDEIKPTILGSLLLGIRTIGKTMGWAALYSYLIKYYELGGLPLIWVLFSILGMIGSLLYLFFADAIKKETLLKYYCLITGSLMILASFFDTKNRWFSIFAFGAYALGTSSLGSQTWTVINAAFTPKQGMRIYPLITLAPLIGGILGGLGSQYLPIGTEIFVLIWGICIIAVIPLLNIFQKNYIKEPQEAPKKTKLSFSRFWKNFKDGCNYTFHNKLMLSIAGICFLFWLVASFKEYPYNQIIKQRFKLEELNQYMGILNTTTKACIVIMQLFITTWIIRRFGVGKSLLLLPFTILIGLSSLSLGLCLGLGNDQLFWIAFGMIFFWEEIAQTIQGTAYQMTFHAVEYSYRGRVRGIVEGIFNNAGGIIGGVLLYLFENFYYYLNEYLKYLKMPEEQAHQFIQFFLDFYKPENNKQSIRELIVSIVGLFFILLWIFVAVQARKNYNNSIVKNLQSKDNKTKKDAEDLTDLNIYSLEEKKAQYTYAKDDETIVQRNVLGGYLTLYFKQDYGCKKMRLESSLGTWIISSKNNCLMLQKLTGHIPRLAISKAEMIYWQTDSGYLAIYWQNNIIKTIEIGNYTINHIEIINCKQDTFQGPFEMLNQGKLVLPQQHFFTAIVTSGEEVK